MAACGRASAPSSCACRRPTSRSCVIANLGSIDPWRLAHAIAAEALEGDKRLKPRLAPITEAEIKPIAGTWFNAEEPSLFDLAWKNGEADGDAERHAVRAGPRGAGGWFGAERGSFEFTLKPGKGGAARRSRRRAACSPSRSSASARPCRRRLAGTYVSANSGATWDIERKRRGLASDVSGPLIAGGAGLDGAAASMPTRSRSTTPAGWITPPSSPIWCATAPARSTALEVSTGRIKKMRFERQHRSLRIARLQRRS